MGTRRSSVPRAPAILALATITLALLAASPPASAARITQVFA
ncbi:hypothetical protein CLOP_g5186, partial [Closterium sp. NIES-67]